MQRSRARVFALRLLLTSYSAACIEPRSRSLAKYSYSPRAIGSGATTEQQLGEGWPPEILSLWMDFCISSHVGLSCLSWTKWLVVPIRQTLCLCVWKGQVHSHFSGHWSESCVRMTSMVWSLATRYYFKILEILVLRKETKDISCSLKWKDRDYGKTAWWRRMCTSAAWQTSLAGSDHWLDCGWWTTCKWCDILECNITSF